MLHIGTGARITHEGAGSFRDFCPICREMRRIEAIAYSSQRRMSVQLVIVIPTGAKERFLHVGRCPECGSRWVVEGLERLRAERRGEPEKRCAVRLALEERVRAGTLPPEERAALLLEPFRRMASMLQLQRGLGGTDVMTAWGCFGVLLLGVAIMTTIPLGLTARHSAPGAGGALAAAVSYLALGFTTGAYFTRHSRYVRRELYPRLARALEPLRPSRRELVDAVKQLREIEPEEGKKFDGARLHDRMRGVIG